MSNYFTANGWTKVEELSICYYLKPLANRHWLQVGVLNSDHWDRFPTENEQGYFLNVVQNMQDMAQYEVKTYPNAFPSLKVLIEALLATNPETLYQK